MVYVPNDNPLHRILKASENETYKEVTALATYYPDSVRVYIPKVPIRRHSKWFDAPPRVAASNEKEQEEAKDKTSNEDSIERSLRRTRKIIKNYVLCNEFDLFCTFTFADDRQNIPRCKQRMATWLKNQRAKYGQMPYLIVPEFHKDGQSLHFHALLHGYKGPLKESYSSSGKPILQNGKSVYELPSYTHGFTNVKKIDQDASSRSKVAFYLQKYITKDMPMFSNKNRYWASHGLKRPITEDNPEEWHKLAKPDWDVITEYGQIVEFNYGTHPVIDIFIEEYRHDA